MEAVLKWKNLEEELEIPEIRKLDPRKIDQIIAESYAIAEKMRENSKRADKVYKR